MLYWQYSSNRIFFLNEYWIFIPPAILSNCLIIRNIYLDKARRKQLEKLIHQLEREKNFRNILLLGLGFSVRYIHLLNRGGSTDFLSIIDTDYIKSTCNIKEGVSYLDDIRLRNIIIDLYRHKVKGNGKIIYITATAICHLANRYGKTFFALPFAMGDFGLTNVYQTFRKALVTILLGAVGPVYMMGGPLAPVYVMLFAVSGLRLAFNNLDFIPTSSVDFTKELTSRIPGIVDVVVVNNRDKIILGEPVKERPECWLADQRILNSNCNEKLTKIPDTSDSVLTDLTYEETVNMQDVTGLDREQFTDQFDLGQTESRIYNKSRRSKEVNFLDKFGDSEQISESEKWDTYDNDFRVSEKKPLGTRNKP